MSYFDEYMKLRNPEDKNYGDLDSIFPTDESFDSIKWLEERHFIKKNSGAWEYEIHVCSARNPHSYFSDRLGDRVYLVIEASRENEYSNHQWAASKWMVRVRAHYPSYIRLSINDRVDSGRHTDVRDCLLDVVDFINTKKEQLREVVETTQETTV